VELLVDANAIPAGCYRFLEVHEDMSIFTVGNEIIIGLATNFWTKFMRPATASGASLSSELDFARRYGELYSQLGTKQVKLDPRRMTFCMISPRLFRTSSSAAHRANARGAGQSEIAH
jgi:hypothetical protein